MKAYLSSRIILLYHTLCFLSRIFILGPLDCHLDQTSSGTHLLTATNSSITEGNTLTTRTSTEITIPLTVTPNVTTVASFESTDFSADSSFLLPTVSISTNQIENTNPSFTTTDYQQGEEAMTPSPPPSPISTHSGGLSIILLFEVHILYELIFGDLCAPRAYSDFVSLSTPWFRFKFNRESEVFCVIVLSMCSNKVSRILSMVPCILNKVRVTFQLCC